MKSMLDMIVDQVVHPPESLCVLGGFFRQNGIQMNARCTGCWVAGYDLVLRVFHRSLAGSSDAVWDGTSVVCGSLDGNRIDESAGLPHGSDECF
jgi:hypothetical protein